MIGSSVFLFHRHELSFCHNQPFSWGPHISYDLTYFFQKSVLPDFVGYTMVGDLFIIALYPAVAKKEIPNLIFLLPLLSCLSAFSVLTLTTKNIIANVSTKSGSSRNNLVSYWRHHCCDVQG